MRILHLASEFPPAQIFGLGRYVHDLARAQVRRGHEVHVLTNSLSGRDQDVEMPALRSATPRREAGHGVQVHRINFPSPPKPADGATQVTQFNALLIERLLELKLRSCDAVVAHDWLTILAADHARRIVGGRLVLTMHDTVIGKTFGRLSNEDKYIAQIERWGCRTADAVVAVSRHVKDELTGIYEAPADRITVVPCGVDPSWFAAVEEKHLKDLRSALAAPESKIVAYVGRLDPEKGVDRLLQALAATLPRFPQTTLVIAGKGSEQPRLEELAKRLRVADHVKLLGYVKGAALEALYKTTDILVCPSTYEPFGIVPLEGMINRVPVIASDVGGMAEIVEHERSGLKVAPNDAHALAAAIESLLADPGKAKRLGDAGHERARRVYGWDRVAELVEAVYSGRVEVPTIMKRRPKLTAGIRVKNGERFADECLRDLSEYVDEIVVLDDGSTDRTIEICRSFPKVTNVVQWKKDFFHEGIDRNVVLALAKNTNPDWILLPDIDEVFVQRFKTDVWQLMDREDVGMYAFLFRHFWRSRTHFRIDGKWGRESREFPIPRLVRNTPSLFYPVDKALGTAQIRGFTGKFVVSDILVKHYGHLYEDLSRNKVSLYSSLDPASDYSFMVDESTLQLEKWEEVA